MFPISTKMKTKAVRMVSTSARRAWVWTISFWTAWRRGSLLGRFGGRDDFGCGEPPGVQRRWTQWHWWLTLGFEGRRALMLWSACLCQIKFGVSVKIKKGQTQLHSDWIELDLCADLFVTIGKYMKGQVCPWNMRDRWVEKLWIIGMTSSKVS